MTVAARRRPTRVSFSGLDGAGKSRQIESLVTALGEGHSVEVIWLPLDVWPQNLVRRLPAGFRSRLGPKRTTLVNDAARAAGRGARSGGVARLVHALEAIVWAVVATFAAVSVALSLRRRSSRSSADLMVLDRYRLDSMVKLQCWYAEVSAGWLARVVRALVAAPDVEFLLRVDPQVAYARKPEQFTVAQLTNQARLYDRLVSDQPAVITLDAHTDADELARQVSAHVRARIDGN